MLLATTESLGLSDSATGWIVLALMLPGLIIVFGLMFTYLLRRSAKSETQPPGDPGYYRVLGVDARTGQKRESLIHAESRMGAEGRARMEGIVITDIEQVDKSDDPG